jgi:hypothetical protein
MHLAGYHGATLPKDACKVMQVRSTCEILLDEGDARRAITQHPRAIRPGECLAIFCQDILS